MNISNNAKDRPNNFKFKKAKKWNVKDITILNLKNRINEMQKLELTSTLKF